MTGQVIAVNVSGVSALHAGVPDDADLSGRGTLMNGLVGRGRNDAAKSASPTLGWLLARAMLLASSNHAATMRNYASLYLTPPLSGVDVSDWHAFDDLIETAYRYASRALETWNRDAPTH